MGTINLNATDLTNIRRLINSPQSDNLALAYNLMIGLGVDAVDAMVYIVESFRCKLTFHDFDIYGIDADEFGFNIERPKHLGGFLTFKFFLKNYSFHCEGFYNELRINLERTRHIWEPLI